jgi:cytosine/adenosine deaminase-related metal-dependent hydrolase
MADPRILIEAHNCTVAVQGGRIVETDGSFDLVLRFPDGEVRPGLINAHEHLHRNHYGRLGSPPYADAYAWAEDIQARSRETIVVGRAVDRRQALLVGAW